jgi:hypothetical protein
MFAGFVALTLTGPLAAQFGGFAGPVVIPPAPPAPADQPVARPADQPPVQPVARPAAQPQSGALTGLPSFAGSATITSTPATTMAPPSFTPQPSMSSGGYDGIGSPNSPYSPYNSPFAPWNYYYDPAGSRLRGLADLTYSYGQFIQDYQKARLLNQQVERSKIETQRKLVEHWLWMSSLTPTPMELRDLARERTLALARKQAPAGDVLTGKTLNDLLAHLKSVHARGARGPAVPINEETLKQINVSPSYGRNVGLIKNARVNWPSALQGTAFAKHREKIDMVLDLAVQRARAQTDRPVDKALRDELDEAYVGLEGALEREAPQMTVTQYIDAQRFLSSLGEGLRALKDPNAGKFFNGDYEARGKTVADLVEYMGRTGLQFVGSVPGNEAAYRSLYNALVAYDEMVSR